MRSPIYFIGVYHFIEKERISGDGFQPLQPVGRVFLVQPLKVKGNGEEFFLRCVSLEDKEGEIVEQYSPESGGIGTSGEMDIWITPFRHIGEMYISEIYSTNSVRISESVEESMAVDLREEDGGICRDDLTMQIAA